MATTSQVTGAIILFALYGITILYFVVRGSRSTKNITDYALGSMQFSPVFVGLSLAAAMTSAATFVINPGLIANFGISGFLSFGLVFPLATLVSLVVLTKSFRKYGQSVNALSLASWIGSRYKSKGYSLFVAFLSVLLLTFIVLIVVALTKVIAQALNADEIVVLALLILFIFGYMMFGGANSMVYTNAVQALIMVVVALIMIGSGIRFFNDGLGSFFEQLKAIDPNLVQPTNPASPLFRDFFEIFVAQIIVGIAVVCQPHIITKSLLLKKETDVNKFLTTSIIAQVLFFLVVVTGLYARLHFPDMAQNGVALNNDSLIPAYVISIFSGGGVSLLAGLLVILGLMSAGFSTVEGLIQSLSTTITTDIFKPLFGARIKKQQTYIVINRLTIAALAVATFVVARDQLLHPNLSVAIFAQNGVYAYFSIIFTPIIFGIFLKKVGLKAPLFASLTALVTYFMVYYGLPALVNAGVADFGYINTYLSGSVRNPAIAAATAIILSVTVGLIAHGVAPKKTDSLQVTQ
jgi:sodium/pantothenate symporter